MKQRFLKKDQILEPVLNSYAQVFFSKSKLLASFLLFISFFDYGAGIGGLTAVIIANLLARVLGYNKFLLHSGLYGFNTLLTGLGIGLFYEPSVELYLLIAVASITCFFLTIVFQGVLGKYGLPYLSVPFLITIWIVALAGNELSALNLSERGIYTYNELYAIGGQAFVNFYEFLENNIHSSFIRIYFHSLGAIFFQTHLLAGIIISLGLLIYSRISFVLSIIGFGTAFLFYKIIGINFNELGYTFIGFNYILTAIALGGYYLIPGRVSFGWIVLLLPAVVLITTSTREVFLLFNISPYSLPFNAIVLMFLYALKLREKRPRFLVETPVQLGKPEKNLYLYSSNQKRFPAAYPVSAALPFYGEWTVSQGHNGEYTHKAAWRHAWDFIITGRQGQQFKNSGDFPKDYHCFDKAVLAPADGTVTETINDIADNAIGDVNTKNNWGNTVILKHNDHLYSKLSHLKYQSVVVKPGDSVKKGQRIGRCGNSGRSPYPHLHFQFQANPYVGAPTIDYPLGHYLLKKDSGYSLRTFDLPQKKDMVANPPRNDLLKKALHFIPGREMTVALEVEPKSAKKNKPNGKFSWVTETDILNNTFIRSETDGGQAYLYNNGDMHHFTSYNGKKDAPLFWFFILLYKIPGGFLPGSRIEDALPVHLLYGGILKYLQDFVAPLFIFLKADYRLTMREAGDILSSDHVTMDVVITKRIAGHKIKHCQGEIKITQQGEFELLVALKKAKIKIICQNKLD